MRIFVDMDDVLVNLLDEWLIHLNNYKGVTPKTKEDIDAWDISKHYPTLSHSQLYGCLSNSEFWKRVQPVEGACEYLRLLKEEGHELYIATSAYPLSFWCKTQHCLFKHFDFLTPKNVICINNKSLLDGDILFDDYHENLRNFNGVKVLRDKPYNKNCDKECFHFRISIWKEFYTVVQELKKVEELH